MLLWWFRKHRRNMTYGTVSSFRNYLVWHPEDPHRGELARRNRVVASRSVPGFHIVEPSGHSRILRRHHRTVEKMDEKGIRLGVALAESSVLQLEQRGHAVQLDHTSRPRHRARPRVHTVNWSSRKQVLRPDGGRHRIRHNIEEVELFEHFSLASTQHDGSLAADSPTSLSQGVEGPVKAEERSPQSRQGPAGGRSSNGAIN
jgi:hypothetical protein